MMENFIEYMWYLLHTPLKKLKKALNKWYIFCRVFGRRFDEAKESILRARDEGMVATCCHNMLVVHGADRGLTQYDGETLENYRSRIAMYEEVCKLGGTNEGVLLAVKTLGYSAPELVRANEMTGFVHFTLDGSWILDGSRKLESDTLENRWAEFYVVLVMDVNEDNPVSFRILQKTVRMWKEVGSKDNYLFRYMLNIYEIYRSSCIQVLYRWKVTSTWLTESVKADYRFDVCHSGEYNILRYEQHNLIFLDGTWKLDGSKVIDAWQKTEVL